MKLQIVGHPARRMRQRGVTTADIESAIRHVVTTRPADDGGITYIGPGIDGRELKVWVLQPGYVDEETTVVVKSVAWRGQ